MYPRLASTVAIALLSVSCAREVVHVPVATPLAAPATTALLLASALPAGGDRCSIAQPERLAPDERPLAALASSSERWAFALPVLAHARVERSSGLARRAVVELARFAPFDGDLRAQLATVLDRPVTWDDAPAVDVCQGEPTCTPWRARFVDAQTLMLSVGEWGPSTGAETDCVALLRAYPQAIEVTARSALLAGTELRDSRARLERVQDGLHRVTTKRYAEAQSAERALREAWRGHDELASLAAVPATDLGQRAGELVVQDVFVRFDDLRLALEDQARATAQVERLQQARVLSAVDLHDADALCAAFDAQRVSASDAPELAALLVRARGFSPDHEGLARRLHQLQLSVLHDPRAALATVDNALARGFSDRAFWQLAARAALARFDEATLRSALRTAHALSADVAARMSRELVQKVAAGEDYERAEWAFLTARELGKLARGRRVALAHALPATELVRMLAYLGQSARPHEDLAVHGLVHGALHGTQTRESFWSAQTSGGGREGLVFAATSWDDAQLRALGGALDARLDDGPFELLLSLEAFASGQRATFALSGQRRAGALWVEQVTRPLDKLPWPLLERVLLAPLRSMVGNAYPPDELVIRAPDAQERSQLARAAESAPQVKCVLDAAELRCHGALSDAGAARRALLALAHERLASEARLLWSGTD